MKIRNGTQGIAHDLFHYFSMSNDRRIGRQSSRAASSFNPFSIASAARVRISSIYADMVGCFILNGQTVILFELYALKNGSVLKLPGQVERAIGPASPRIRLAEKPLVQVPDELSDIGSSPGGRGEGV